ncbi:MAG TPA: hypothetical protein VND70_10655, partial [Acidimicrobiales bacterium]|nr:hypothetical protein [Acidimicrobiales bacterium]
MVATSVESTLEGAVRTLAGAVRTLQEIVRTTQPGSCSGDEAREMVGLWGEAERAAASAIALLS